MNQFYLTLPSNSIDRRSAAVTNTQGEFRTYLPHRISLDGDWEVALCEIIYTHSWYNVDRGKEGKDRSIIVNDTTKGQTLLCEVEPGFYETVDEVVAAVNTAMSRICAVLDVPVAAKFTYDSQSKRVVIRLTKRSQSTMLFMGQKLRYMLGFDLEDLTRIVRTHQSDQPVTIKAKYPVDLRGGLDTLYVYCDLVSNQVVGNVTAPLLRVVAVQGHHDEVVSALFANPHYVPVCKREFDTVEINIKDDKDDSVKFLYGKTIVKLHFRRKKFSLL